MQDNSGQNTTGHLRRSTIYKCIQSDKDCFYYLIWDHNDKDIFDYFIHMPCRKFVYKKLDFG